MKRPLTQYRPIGPFMENGDLFDSDDEQDSKATFKIEGDTIDDSVNDEVQRIVTPTFDYINDVQVDEVSRLDDFIVTIDTTEYMLSDISELMRSLDKAESRGVGIYQVQINK